jgi:hypothetical protein
MPNHNNKKQDKLRPPVVLGNGGPKGYKGKTYKGLEYINRKTGQRWIYHNKKWVLIPTSRGPTGSTGLQANRNTGSTGTYEVATRTVSSAMFSVQSRANPQIFSSVGLTGGTGLQANRNTGLQANRNTGLQANRNTSVYDTPGTPYGTFSNLPTTPSPTGSFNPATGIFIAGYTGAYQFNAAGQIFINGAGTTPTLSLYVVPLGETDPQVFNQVSNRDTGNIFPDTANISLSTIMAMNVGDQAYIQFSNCTNTETESYNVNVSHFSCSYVGPT